MKKIKQLRKLFNQYNLDGYIVPKNNNFFGEYVPDSEDNLKFISDFTGSAGFAIILKNKNLMFVDGRYSTQASIQCGKNYKIFTIPKKYPFNVFGNKKLNLGFDPKLHTENSLNRLFKNSFIKLKPIDVNLIDLLWKRKKNVNIKPFYLIKDQDAGEKLENKLIKLRKLIALNKVDYLFTTAPENVAWLLNIRGHDTDYSPLPNSHAIIGKNKEIVLFCNLKKIDKSLKLKLNKKVKICNIEQLPSFIANLSNKKILIDILTCSIFFKKLINIKNLIIEKQDPIYLLKSLKNKIEIKNSIKSHIYDGVALAKFIFWLKASFKTKKITEISAQEKLLKFRKKNKSFYSLSFPTISGSGPNGAIIHYKADKKSNRLLKKGDVYLVDSGGQYLYGTTDVTRTLSLGVNNSKIKEIFTRVLKGHIAVASYKLNQNSNGDKIDYFARKPLRDIKLDYPHGTGHGVGSFLNVHEGPQGISRGNKVRFQEGMITSNEPGFYKKNHFGIRIENLIYVKKIKNKLKFIDLTLVPIDKSLIEKKLLTSYEQNWLNSYHQRVFKNLKQFMSKLELTQLQQACSDI
ncbi:aminopeptidase P family protein [Pelagibacteraceae bacterium]|nr:aminopeptidase P family protein [Pelagibacteraceae bacterium]